MPEGKMADHEEQLSEEEKVGTTVYLGTVPIR